MGYETLVGHERSWVMRHLFVHNTCHDYVVASDRLV
jgi:hypothetical protein